MKDQGTGQGGSISAEELRALEDALKQDAAVDPAANPAHNPGTADMGLAPDVTPAPTPALVEATPAHGHELTHLDHAGLDLEPALTIQSFFQSWELFGDSAMVGAMAGALLGALGVYVIMRRMVFLSAALSQVASLGIVAAFFLRASLGLSLLSPSWGALILGVAAVLLLSSNHPAIRERRDNALGFVFLLGASGTLLLGTKITQELHDVQTILFGTAVAVVPEDAQRIFVMVAAFGLLHLIGHRGFISIVTDRDDAAVRGLPTRTLELLLLGSLAASVSISTGVLGALPTFAFSVLPAMAALAIAANLTRAMLLASALGATCGFLGYLAAYLYSWPVGASQTLLCLLTTALFTLAATIRARLVGDG